LEANISRCRKIERNFAKCVKFCEMCFRLQYAKCANFFLQNEIKNEIWAFLARITKRNLVLFKRNTGQGQAVHPCTCSKPLPIVRVNLRTYKGNKEYALYVRRFTNDGEWLITHNPKRYKICSLKAILL